ncbi:hypothetical protein BDN70DRAFT_939822 [Pholiota conissans]|uniref:Uncharacterized protein n=1 Tax=Pholiota conissans TaxID=109636 RepID=A0A9P5YJ90_9AGAR|nr:hypothetical protein BDN70DRAFT_939822 [Pholiota conissans]
MALYHHYHRWHPPLIRRVPSSMIPHSGFQPRSSVASATPQTVYPSSPPLLLVFVGKRWVYRIPQRRRLQASDYRTSLRHHPIIDIIVEEYPPARQKRVFGPKEAVAHGVVLLPVVTHTTAAAAASSKEVSLPILPECRSSSTTPTLMACTSAKPYPNKGGYRLAKLKRSAG